MKKIKHTGRLRGFFNFSKREIILIILGGAGLFLGLPNPLIQLPLCVLLFPFAISCLALEAPNEGKAISSTLGVTLLGGGLAVHWVVYPMINFGGVPLILAIIFTLLMVAILSLYYVVYTLLLRFYHASLPAWLMLLAAAFTWGALEYLRGWLFTGVTWCTVSSAMLGWPVFAQPAALFGLFGLSAIYAFDALCFLPLFSQIKIRPLPLAALGLGIIGVLGLYGVQRMAMPFNGGTPVIIAQAQGNFDQGQKWLPEHQMTTTLAYIDLSLNAINESVEKYGKKPDLLVWPETSIPFYFQQPSSMSSLIRSMVKKQAVPLAFGVPAKGMANNKNDSYNRVWFLDAAGNDAGYYDKEHLVPFGEYIPKGLYVPFASEFLQGHGFTPGTSAQPLSHHVLNLGVLICYEAIFPELAQARVSAGANILVNVSNDGWFADSPAPWQHLQLSAMRSIEQGRYMIRSTNTGLSAMIDPTGRVHGLGPLFKAYSSVHEAYLLEDKTFFNQHFSLINSILAYSPFIFIMLGLLFNFKKRRKA